MSSMAWGIEIPPPNRLWALLGLVLKLRRELERGRAFEDFRKRRNEDGARRKESTVSSVTAAAVCEAAHEAVW